MTRYLKTLGLALLALAAFGAIAAQGASALTHKFHSTVEQTVLTGTNETGTIDKFRMTKAGVEKSRVECTDTSISGTQTGLVTESITVHPKYTGCELVIGVQRFPATVKTGGCNFEFFGVTTTSADLTGEHASTSVDCETTTGEHKHQFEISSNGCLVKVGVTNLAGTALVNQNLHGVTYTNVKDPEKTAVTVTSTVRTIHFTTTGANCSLLGFPQGAEYAEADYDGVALVTGYEDKKVTGGSTTEGFTYEEGAQVSVSVE